MFAIVPVMLFAALSYLTIFVDVWFLAGAAVMLPIAVLITYAEMFTIEVVDESFVDVCHDPSQIH